MRSVAALFVVFALVSCGGEGGGDASAFGRRAVDLVEAMEEERFGDVREALHPGVAERLSEDRLRQAWEEFIGEHGEIDEIGAPEVEEDNGTLVTVGLDMSKRDAEAQVRFLPSGEVVGFDFGAPE